MNYGGNMPDWHQYNSTQPIGSEVPPVGQNANHSPIFGPNISPRRLNGPTYSPEGLNKPQNEANFNPRNFQQSPNTLNGPNVPLENSPMGSAAQMSSCHGPYGSPSPRNTMIEGPGASLDSRSIPSSSLNEVIGQRNHQISMSRPAAPLNCSTMNASMGPMGQRNTTTSLQGPIPTSSRQGPGSYIPCKLPCCNPDTNISYQSWEKFGPYPPNVPYRDAGYPVDNRRFSNDFENREQLGTAGAYNIDPRRNFSDYKYRKDSIFPRTYTHSPGVIQNYPIQNYNFPADYQKYPAYPIKDYPRESAIANPQNPALLKYQEQSVIVQQKYFTKQIQYQNGAIPKTIVPNNMGGSVISRAQNPYFNPQLARDFPRNYSESTPIANRGLQTTNPIQAAYPKYQMYQQKIAMQRFSMENHLRELTRIPGYQSHPKYQESVLRYRELLRLQQTVDYQSTMQDPPKVASSQINEEIPPINLQFDQNGVLINTNFVPPGFSNLQSPINLQNSKNVQSVSNTELGPLNLQYSEQFKTQANEARPLNLRYSEQFKTQTSIDNRVQDQDSASSSQTELPHKNERHYSVEKDQLHGEKYESESVSLTKSDDGKTSSMHQRNSRDFADKPELDVRQFLANWDESEDEDGTNINLPDVVLSNSTTNVVEYENTKAVPDNPGETENCSETEDCRGRDDCGIFENTQTETKSSNSTDNRSYECDLPPAGESSKSVKQDSDISDAGKKPVRTGTVIQPTSIEREKATSLHIMENLTDGEAANGNAKLLHQQTESLNNDECKKLIDTVEDDIIVKEESAIEEETITSIKEHIKDYNKEASTEICSSIGEIMEDNDDNRSRSGKESSEDTKHHYSSSEDLSESSDSDSDSDSMDTDSISSYIKSPKTIKGTEIHVDAQELSAIPDPPKSNSEMLDSTNLQKQSSFTSEESHNPDDISLPDLPTSECTPISTTLNTPIHSDSEESSEPVIDLTTPANPIEIIQNSPMLSFTHSPIKMEPYEHLDENDITDKVSHDALHFEFQASNSCDNDYEKLSDVSSHTTDQYNIAQTDENTLDSDCVEILSAKSEPKIEVHTGKVETKNDVIDKITDRNRFGINEENVTTDKTNTIVNAEHEPWSSVTVREDKRQISNNTKHQNAKTDIDKLETLSEMKDKLSIMSEVTKDHIKDDMMHMSGAKNYHSTKRRETKREIENDRFESTDNMTALNLVKDKSKIKPESTKMTDESANSEVVAKESKNGPSNSNEGIDEKHLNQSECNSSMENEPIFTSTENTVEYSSSSEEDTIYTENIKSQSNFTGSLNIPLIPGEDFEEPKMPVLPMEGNCLTKIIKNTSPITDLDVLGSDDEKLDKMDEIWIEVGGVETEDKVTDENTDAYTACSDGSDREKSLSSRNKLRVLQKKDWKCLKNSKKPKDPSKLFRRLYIESQESNLKSTTEIKLQQHEPTTLQTTRKVSEPIVDNVQSAIISETDNTGAILQEKDNFTKVPNISRVTSNSSFREDGKQSWDTLESLESNASEVLKSKEKGNHINDIATKLLENARLSEPELRKIEVQRKVSTSGENTIDGSKRRIKLLKEFRKVKNKINTDRPEVELAKSPEVVENNAVSSIEIVEQCKKVDAGIMGIKNKVITSHNAFTDTSKNVLPKSDSEIINSISTHDSHAIQTSNANTEENTLHAISTDIATPGEKLKHVSNNGKPTSKNEDILRESCSIINTEDSITAEDTSGVNSHDSLDVKIASPIEEDINECAINLSKSSNDFDVLQSLSEKGCATDVSHNSMKNAEPTEIECKTNEETTCTESNDDNLILSQSLYPEDSRLCTETVKDYDKTQVKNHVELQDAMEGNCESNSASTITNSADEYILKEDTKQEIDQESTRTANRQETEVFLSNPGKVENEVKSCSHQEKMDNNICENRQNFTDVCETNDVEMNTFVSKKSGYPKSNGLVAVDDKKDEKLANETVASEATLNTENIWNDVSGTSTVNAKESMKLIDSFDKVEKRSLSNHSPEAEVSIANIENSLENLSNVSEEKVLQSLENCIEITSAPHQERNIGKSTVAQELMESEPMIENDCSIGIQKTNQDLDVTTNIHTESKTTHNDFESIEKPSISNQYIRQTQSEQCTSTKCLQNTNVELVSRTHQSLSTVDATFEAFGLENSFNDFSNFDVAPNFSNTEDTDQSNNWKYAKAYARFEDCERYKNPDNFVNPILTSLETLDNLNTVPVYTTKDGKITYSPNPKFTYRALIMEAREREGYPALRKSYCENPRVPESTSYGKNQASFRKRKNSEAYSYSGSYGKKNYSEYYEPREHGESSMKNLSEPWNRSYFNYNKYSHLSRDRNSNHFTRNNSDAEKKHAIENVAKDKFSSKYKHREGYTVFEEHNKRKNGTSHSFKCNNKKQYTQSREQSTSDSVWSRNRQNLKCNKNSPEIAPSKSETDEMVNKKRSKNLQEPINIKNDMKDFQQIENSTSTSDENKHISQPSTNILQPETELRISSDTLLAEKIFPDPRDNEFESSFPNAENKPSSDPGLLEISNHTANEGLTSKQGLFSSEWEDSCENLTVQWQRSCEMKIPTESLLDEIKEVCDKNTKVNLYNEVDDICQTKAPDKIEKRWDDTDLSNDKCVTPLNSVKSPISNEIFEDPDCNLEILNIDKDESTNAENIDESYSISVEVIRTDKDADKQKMMEIPETPNKSEPEASSNQGTESTREEDKIDEPPRCTDGQLSTNCTENCTSEVKDVDHEDLVTDEIRTDEPNKVASLIQIGEVQDNLVALESNDQILHNSENLCSEKNAEEIETNELKIKSYKIETENKDGTSVKNLQQTSNDSVSLKMISEYENTSKPHSQCENYVTYSPSNDSPEDTKAIPKLVIKKTDSLNCKNVCLGPSSATSYGAFIEKVSDKEEHGSKMSMHPKIPKILIRNAKSRPSTPSIEEVTDKKTFSVTTKEDSKVPKVKIRFEEKRPRSPNASGSENVSKTEVTETKIPKIKIKLEDRLPKVIIANINMESCGSNEEAPKTIPKMKIKKCKGALRQIVDTQILPVSIPRMFISTELESEKETALQIFTKKEDSTTDKIFKSVTPSSIQEDQKTVKDADPKKIPKLKIKRQSSGCSVELNRKRHSVNPVQSELKKVKKSLKLVEPNDKKQVNKSSVGSEHHDSSKKLDTFSVKQSYELASSKNVKYTTVAQSSEPVRGEQTKSTERNISGTPEEIPKVIIKRVSPSAEFKCELSKVRRDAIIKNKRWQPEVKLQRSWVLDCMAKDLNLDKLRLKLATPDSVLKKSLPKKKSALAEACVENGNANTNQNEQKLFRSKSTSELILVNGNFGKLAKNDTEQLNETNATDLPKKLITPKRCKSDLGNTYSKYSENFECKKKLRYNNHSSTIQLASKPTLNYVNDFANSSSVQSVEKADMVAEEHRARKDSETTLNFKEIQNNNKAVHLMESFERSQDKTQGVNLNLRSEISKPKIDTLLLNNETSNRSFVDMDLNSRILSCSTNTTNNPKTNCESFENSNDITNIFVNDSKADGTHKVNDSQSHYSATKCTDRLEVSKDSVIVKNTNVDSVKRHTKSGKKNTKEIKNQGIKTEETVGFKNNNTSSIKNMSTNYIDEEKTCKISATSMASHDRTDQVETVTNDIKVTTQSAILQAPISMKPDIDIPRLNSEICSFDALNTINDLETINCKNNIYKLDINDNSDGHLREEDDNNTVIENSISYMNIVEQENTSTLNENVLITSASELTESDAKDIQDPNICINLNNRSDSAVNSGSNSVENVESSEEGQNIIDILSDSPILGQSEVEIQLCPDVIEENGMCLYHEDAIPTQFELELEIIDNTVPDPLEVPMPQNDHPIEEFRIYSGDESIEDSHRSSRILNNSRYSVNLDDSNSETTLPEENNSQVCSLSIYQREVFAYPDKQDTILSVDSDKQNSTSNTRMKTSLGFDSKVQKSVSCSDLLVKEVLAAQEKPRKCFVKTKNESRLRFKSRPKTAAEKKQGSSFDPNTLATSEDSSTKLENHSSINFIAEANSLKQMNENFSSANNNEKSFHNQIKTEFKVNKMKSDRKHSEGSKNNLMQRKYSSLPTNIQKFEQQVEFTKGVTTISLKNSKNLIKNHSYSDARKKMPELTNSKDSRSRSKPSKHDVDSKYVGKSKIALPNTVVQESSFDFGQCEEKPVSDAAKPKYKSLKTSLDHNVNLVTDKAKFKLYKIPKKPKSTHPENGRLTEELQESHSKEARMPILEPQVDLNGSLEVSELSSDRESSRSPPVITNQESRDDHEISPRSLECQVLLNNEEGFPSRERTSLLETEVPEAVTRFGKETTVADIVNDMAYHEKATIRHRRYCTLCERWFPTVTRYRRHLSGYQHRHTELTQRRTIHALFTLFTGRPCPRLQPPGVVRIDCEPGELTPLQIAIQGVTKESNKVDGNIKKPTREDK